MPHYGVLSERFIRTNEVCKTVKNVLGTFMTYIEIYLLPSYNYQVIIGVCLIY